MRIGLEDYKKKLEMRVSGEDTPLENIKNSRVVLSLNEYKRILEQFKEREELPTPLAQTLDNPNIVVPTQNARFAEAVLDKKDQREAKIMITLKELQELIEKSKQKEKDPSPFAEYLDNPDALVPTEEARFAIEMLEKIDQGKSQIIITPKELQELIEQSKQREKDPSPFAEYLDNPDALVPTEKARFAIDTLNRIDNKEAQIIVTPKELQELREQSKKREKDPSPFAEYLDNPDALVPTEEAHFAIEMLNSVEEGKAQVMITTEDLKELTEISRKVEKDPSPFAEYLDNPDELVPTEEARSAQRILKLDNLIIGFDEYEKGKSLDSEIIASAVDATLFSEIGVSEIQDSGRKMNQQISRTIDKQLDTKDDI